MRVNARLDAARALTEGLITTWPVLTQSVHLMRGDFRAYRWKTRRPFIPLLD